MNQTVLDILREMREAEDAILERHELSWPEWTKLRDTAARDLADEKIESLDAGKYEVRLEARPVRIFPAGTAISHYTYRLAIHRKREEKGDADRKQ